MTKSQIITNQSQTHRQHITRIDKNQRTNHNKSQTNLKHITKKRKTTANNHQPTTNESQGESQQNHNNNEHC